MADASPNPDTFLTQVDKAIELVDDKLNEYFEKVANAVAGHLAEIGGVGGFLLGGPLGGVGGYLLGKHLEEQVEGKMDEIWTLWEQTRVQIRQDIGSMLGDPLKMSRISSDYKDAVVKIGDQHGKVEGANAYLEDSWSGNAYIAYKNMSTAQLAAMSGMAQMLGDAADLLDDNQQRLLSFWNQQLQNLADLVTDIIGLMGELGDVGNWPTGGAGTALKIIAACGSSAASILTDTNEYMIGLNVGSAGDWDSLNSKFGTNGLPERQWPDYQDIDLSNINGPWQPA